ncbi:MAG: ABC transporter permease [Clostridia bacterium]|nr:ABC transporter permease [Clostridia bacterium]
MMKTEKKVQEPIFHVVKKDGVVLWRAWLIRAAAIVLALLVCALLILVMTDQTPVEVFESIFEGAIGVRGVNVMALFQSAAMLLCISLAVTPAFKMKFWNIGAEGQVLMGGLAAAACMICLRGVVPNGVLILLIFVTGVLAGMLWGVIPALFKAQWGTNETLFTLMMNYAAMQIVSFFVVKWENPKNSGKIGIINQRGEFKQAGWLPELFDVDYLLNILIVLAVMILAWVYLKYSKQGFEITVVGESENTARYVGINVKKVIIRTMAISGAICGLAGVLLVAGTHHTIAANTAGGNGFTAVMVSWLAKFNPFVMAGVSFFIAFLEKGAGGLATNTGLNASFADIIIGILLFFIIGCEFFLNYRIVVNKQRFSGRLKQKGGE